MIKDDPYINDRFNFILLIAKSRDYKLTCGQKRELKRLMKSGFYMGEGDILEYANVLKQKAYIKILPAEGDNELIVSITDQGLKAIKYHHFPSPSKGLKLTKRSRRFEIAARIATVIATLLSLIAIIISTRSCSNHDEMDSLHKRIDAIEQKLK